MELIGYYILFAFSVSLTACYFWFWPLLREAKIIGIKNSFTEYPITSTIIYVIISAVVAPLLVLPILSSSMALRFETGLKKEMLKPD